MNDGFDLPTFDNASGDLNAVAFRQCAGLLL
jgi:hypothetical protein